MDAVTDDGLPRHIDAGDGTPESEWLAWPPLDGLARISLDEVLPAGSRAVVVAPHPDDEVLSVGGMLAELAVRRQAALVVAVTDGDASHPGSGLWTPSALAEVRRAETATALDRLGLPPGATLRLGVPDGRVEAGIEGLIRKLAEGLTSDDVVFSTWRLDGHPDHEATARACAAAVEQVGARLVEVPVWAWHWARPADPRWPWDRARRLDLSPEVQHRKRHAVQAFRSQLEPDASTGAPPILRNTTVARASRPFEVMFL